MGLKSSSTISVNGPVINYAIKSERANGTLEVADLRNLVATYGFADVFAELKSVIAERTKEITIADVLAVVNNTPKTSNGYTDASAAAIFEAVYAHLLYKLVVNSSPAAATLFYTNINNASSTTTVAGSGAFADLMMGLIAPNAGDHMAEILAYRLPASDFTYYSIKASAATGGAAAGATIVVATTSGNPSAVATPLSPYSSGFSGLATVDDIISKIMKGVATTGVAGLVKSDFPSSFTLNQALKYITAVASGANDASAVTTAQIDQALALSTQTSGINLLAALNAFATGTHGNPAVSNAIPKVQIAKSSSDSVKAALLALRPDALLDYVPANGSADLPLVLYRTQFEALVGHTTDIWTYSDEVKRVKYFAELSGKSVEDLSDIFVGNDANATSVKALLQITTAAPATATSKVADNSAAGNDGDLLLTSVFAAYKHYLKTSETDLSKLQDAESIARYLSDDYIKSVITNATYTSSQAAGNLDGSATDHLWSDYLNACKDTHVSKRPSLNVDVIYDALIILAEQKRSFNPSVIVSPQEIVAGWLGWVVGSTNFIRGDIPKDNGVAGKVNGVVTTSDTFWGTSAQIDDITQDANVKKLLVSYILAPTGTAKFALLDEPANEKYFAQMIKVSGVDGLPKQLYGLDSAVSSSTGKPDANWGSAEQIMAAVAKLPGMTIGLQMSTEILVRLTGSATAFSTYAELESLASKYGLSTIVNMATTPVDKAGAVLISPASPGAGSHFSESSNKCTTAYPGMVANSDASNALNAKLLHVARMIDLANNGGVSDAQEASRVNAVLSVLDEATYKQFLELYVYYTGTPTTGNQNASTNGPTILRDMGKKLVMNRLYNHVGKYGRTADWRAAYVASATEIFTTVGTPTALITFDQALETGENDANNSDRLTVAKTNHAMKIAELIRYQLNSKVPMVNPVTLVPEARETLADYAAENSLAFQAKTNKDCVVLSVLGYVAAASSGNKMQLSESEYNELIAAGVLSESIERMAWARRAIKAHKYGGVEYLSLVGFDDNGEVMFE